ncbi:MAG TPA: N-acetylmuramoyl-L-alanine amidase [Thermoanaerobaculia bacterium]
MNVQQYPLKKSQYFPDLTEKKFVVWHGTAGRTAHTPVSGRPGKATTSIDGWNLSADRVGAPWLVDRDGTVYQTFNDSAWIYHLGLKGTKGSYDKQSVAIEFANEGPLDLDGDRLYAFGMNTPNTVYNGPFIAHDWRGFGYFAQLDEAQLDAGIELTLDICKRHNIEPAFYYPSTTFDFPRCFQVATIVCHSNCRADKTDLCLPQWVYEKIEAAGIRLVS